MYCNPHRDEHFPPSSFDRSKPALGPAVAQVSCNPFPTRAGGIEEIDDTSVKMVTAIIYRILVFSG
jgi:hypothetical protein